MTRLHAINFLNLWAVSRIRGIFRSREVVIVCMGIVAWVSSCFRRKNAPTRYTVSSDILAVTCSLHYMHVMNF